MTALRHLESGCRGCPSHVEKFGREEVWCGLVRHNGKPKRVPPEDVLLTPDFCPKSNPKFQEGQ